MASKQPTREHRQEILQRHYAKMVARADHEIPYPVEKRCCRCKEIRPAADFALARQRRDGLKSTCKICIAKQWAEQQDAKGRRRQMSPALRKRIGRLVETPPIEETPDGPIMRVPLGNGTAAVIDASDWSLIADYAWHAGNLGYPSTNIVVNGKRRIITMHRIIFGPTGGLQVDHRDRDVLNNRRSNLRAATIAQQKFNQGKRPGGTSRFKGVRRLSHGSWNARIAFQGKQRDLGCFKSEEQAARAYDAAAREFFGPFAALNFPT